MNKHLLVLLLNCIGLFCYGQATDKKTGTNTETSCLNSYKFSVTKTVSAANDYINFYQKYISAARGQDCPMYPSCSNYGLKTFGEQNFAKAFILTTDRLLRCGHDHTNYALTLRTDGFKLLDYPPYENPPANLLYSRNSYYFAYSDTTHDDSTNLLIKKMMNQQYFEAALLEIMRAEIYSYTFNCELFINKIICLRATENYEKALFEYETKCPPQYKLNAELVFQISLIEYKLQNFDNALLKSKSALSTGLDVQTQSKILLLTGLIYANKCEWDSAKINYQSLLQSDRYKKIAESNYALSEKAFQFKNKKPGIASAISVIPGAGYAYTDHMQTAVSALLINGLLAYATYTNFKSGNYGMGVLTGIFNLSFYIGNIYGAAKSAKRYNELHKRTIINKLEYNTNF